MVQLNIGNRWRSSEASLRIRWAAHLDQVETGQRIESLLRRQGHPIRFEVFDRSFTLCEPDVPGVKGDPDIAIVLGEAELSLYFVAQRERGALSALSVHESIHDAVRDFLGRAMDNSGPVHVSQTVVLRVPL